MSSTSILAYVILTISIGYAFVYPSVGDLSILLQEKQKYVDILDMVSDIENKKNELLAKFNDISTADKKDIETVLPNSLNFVRLISQIDAVAANYGISIDRISSRDSNPSGGSSIEDAGSRRIYSSSIIGFSFDASYEKFNGFMSDLERSLRILDVKSIRLETKDTGIYSYSVEFETYWLQPM